MRGYGAEVAIAVHNQGPPIPRKALRDVFEPTVRNVQDPTSPATALGLGLYIAKEVVTAHCGEIDLISSAGGTTVTVRLPRQRRGEVRVSPPPARVKARKAPRAR